MFAHATIQQLQSHVKPIRNASLLSPYRDTYFEYFSFQTKGPFGEIGASSEVLLWEDLCNEEAAT